MRKDASSSSDSGLHVPKSYLQIQFSNHLLKGKGKHRKLAAEGIVYSLKIVEVFNPQYDKSGGQWPTCLRSPCPAVGQILVEMLLNMIILLNKITMTISSEMYNISVK